MTPTIASSQNIIPNAGAIRSWVELYGPMSEAHENAHLGAAIALISAAIGWKAHIKWGENSEPCTVNVIIEGGSAVARKTTVAASAYEIAREAMKGKEDPQLRVRSMSHTSNRGLLELVAPQDKDEAETWEQFPPPGTLIYWDEFGGVLGDPGDLKGGNSWLGQLRATLMQVTNGRHGGLQTGGVKMPGARCAVSILATMTREELEKRVSVGLLRDGFMGRFVLIPYPGRARLLPIPPKQTLLAMRQREELIEWIESLVGQTASLGNVFDRLTDDAADLRATWYEDWVTRLEKAVLEDPSEINRGLLEAFSRLQTTALKVATVMAVSEWAPPTPFNSIQVEEHHVEYGHLLAEHALQEVADLAQNAGVHEHDVYARKVIEFLQRRGPTMRNDLLRGIRSSLPRQKRWEIIKGLWPDEVEIEVVRSGGRPGNLIRLPGQGGQGAQGGA
jgi:hypothetical protein